MDFVADKVKINGPKADGGFTVSFETGEYEAAKVAALLSIPPQTAMKVTVTANE